MTETSIIIVGAPLPPLRMVKCPACRGRRTQEVRRWETTDPDGQTRTHSDMRTISFCYRCVPDGGRPTGVVTADPPARCPWCFETPCLTTNHDGDEEYPIPGCYACGGRDEIHGACYGVGEFCEPAPCPTITDHVDKVIGDMAAESGKELIDFLIGAKCPVGHGDWWNPTQPSDLRWHCSQCSGTNRIVDPSVAELLNRFRTST